MKAWIIAAALLGAGLAAEAAEPIVPTEALGEAAMVVATAAVECGLRPKEWADHVVAAATQDALGKAPGDTGDRDAGAASGLVTRVVGVGRFLALAEVKRDRQATCGRVTRSGALDPFDAMARARAARAL